MTNPYRDSSKKCDPIWSTNSVDLQQIHMGETSDDSTKTLDPANSSIMEFCGFTEVQGNTVLTP